MANSHMFAHGTRSAAMPRSSVPPRCMRKPSTVRAVPMRLNTRRGAFAAPMGAALESAALESTPTGDAEAAFSAPTFSR